MALDEILVARGAVHHELANEAVSSTDEVSREQTRKVRFTDARWPVENRLSAPLDRTREATEFVYIMPSTRSDALQRELRLDAPILGRATDKLVEDACAARILFVVQVVLAHRSSSPHRSDAFKVATADCMRSTRVRLVLSYTSRCL
jgi:hypothetical protein